MANYIIISHGDPQRFPAAPKRSQEASSRGSRNTPGFLAVGLVLTLFGGACDKPDASIQSLIGELEHPNAQIRSGGAQKLGRLFMNHDARSVDPKAAEVVKALMRTLRDADGGVRAFSAEALGFIGNVAEAAVPSLIETAKDKEAAVRYQAVKALGGIDSAVKLALPVLVITSSDDEPSVRRISLQSMALIAPKDKATVSVVIRALKDTDSAVRSEAADLFRFRLPKDENVALALMANLDDDNHFVVVNSAWALSVFGSRAKAAIPALRKLLDSTDKSVATTAALALARIDTENCEKPVSFLIRCLQDSNLGIRQKSAEALEEIGPAANPAVPALVEVVTNRKNPTYVRRAAIGALAKIGINEQRVLKVLNEALKDPDPAIASRARDALTH